MNGKISVADHIHGLENHAYLCYANGIKTVLVFNVLSDWFLISVPVYFLGQPVAHMYQLS